jgi:hypothetical protein
MANDSQPHRGFESNLRGPEQGPPAQG